MNTLTVKVFISSRLRELSGERDIAQKVIESHRFDPDRSEAWGAVASHTEDTCRRHVRNSDIVVLVVGREFSQMVANEYDEARKYRKPCLVFVKSVSNREERMRQFVDETIDGNQFYREFDDHTQFKNYLDLSISNLVEEKFKSDKERRIIQRAHKQCAIMNEMIENARFVPSTPSVSLETTELNEMKVRLLTEKRGVEKILREGL